MEQLYNYIGGEWLRSNEKQVMDVLNPASQDVIAQVPYGKDTRLDVQAAVAAAEAAYPLWSSVPVSQRIQALFKLKQLIEENITDLARTITIECGKTFSESKGELQRAIENVETACAMPALIQGEFSEDIATGIDEFMIRQPLGACACIAPFNFPAMIPFWFLPYALACGNTFVIKPSEKVPVTMHRVFQLIDKLKLPKGVVNLVNGGKDAVDVLLEHPKVKAISFVGSTQVARYVYSKGASHGKRVQAHGGAKNPAIILPDADLNIATRIITDSVFGCAGQRCLAASNIITVGDRDARIKDSLYEASKSKTTGYGLSEGVEMGPLITSESKKRVERLIEGGIKEGARLLLDGRNIVVSGFEEGNFVGPTILEDVPLAGDTVRTEIFGPVMSLIELSSVDEALQFVNSNKYGNMACIFTSSGASARKFRREANAGNIGINVGVAAPVSPFPFSGWNDSFFGDLHGQGRHAVEFFTQTKVVIERWPKEWTRKF